jgi:hypothetical protein
MTTLTKRTKLEAYTEDLHLDEETARKLIRAMAGKLPEQEDMESHEIADYALELADEVMGGYGVEPLTVEGVQVDRHYYGIVALYVNMGDTYSPTVLYDTARETFHSTSLGDWVERQEASGRYQFD